MQTGAFYHGFLDSNEIGYLRYSSFMSQVTNEDLDYMLNRYKDTKGLIIDVRENGGGNMFNIPLIMERFVEERKLVAYSKTRNGIDHNDFTEPDGFYFNPYEGVRYTKPVVILIDRGSYSATTFFSLSSKALDNITLVGDTTGGGGGLPNGGQLPNGWTYRFSITQLLDLSLNNFAESGVPPDILESFDWSDLTKDKILDRAILELN
jgi:C-terminal processing protease CtpA/Prc